MKHPFAIGDHVTIRAEVIGVYPQHRGSGGYKDHSHFPVIKLRCGDDGWFPVSDVVSHEPAPKPYESGEIVCLDGTSVYEYVDRRGDFAILWDRDRRLVQQVHVSRISR